MRYYRRSQITEIATLLGVGLVLIGVTAGVVRVYKTADQAHDAICALRQERVDSITDARRFLRRHPQGIPGISRADILKSIETQKQTVRAFRFADC